MTSPEESTARTFALTVSYDGTRYAGWQVQPKVRTIQGELERSVRHLVEPESADELRILGSGRTDAGVHAIGQVARCVLPKWRASGDALRAAINSRLPDDILVRDASEAVEGFHPIADAIDKTYRYQLQIGGDRHPIAHRYHHRVGGEVDVELLHAASVKFLGEHDFAAFQAAGAQRESTVRTLTQSQWSRQLDAPLSTMTPDASWWVYEVRGNGFLYNMVRNLVGTMLEVARGYRPLEWIEEVIASGDRKTAGPTAPPQGLFLQSVRYPELLF